MYAFLNLETGHVDVYMDCDVAYAQASFVGQRFVACFDEDEPYIVELLEGEEGNDET